LVPGGAVTVKVSVPAGGTLTEGTLNVGERGVGGVAESDTAPLKLPEGVTVIVVLFDNPPAIRVRKY
jgi:hypothetical protein